MYIDLYIECKNDYGYDMDVNGQRKTQYRVKIYGNTPEECMDKTIKLLKTVDLRNVMYEGSTIPSQSAMRAINMLRMEYETGKRTDDLTIMWSLHDED